MSYAYTGVWCMRLKKNEPKEFMNIHEKVRKRWLLLLLYCYDIRLLWLPFADARCFRLFILLEFCAWWCVCVCVHWICYCLLVECHYRNSEWFRHVNNFAVISAGIRGDSLLYTDAGLWKCNVQVACMCSSYSYALIAHKVNDVDSGVAKLYMRAEQTNSVCLLANKQLAHGDYHFFFAEVVRAGKWKSEAEKKLDNKTKIVNISVAVDGGCVARETIIKEEISSIGKLKMRAIDHNILWFFFYFSKGAEYFVFNNKLIYIWMGELVWLDSTERFLFDIFNCNGNGLEWGFQLILLIIKVNTSLNWVIDI